jgi:hypothetical protein
MVRSNLRNTLWRVRSEILCGIKPGRNLGIYWTSEKGLQDLSFICPPSHEFCSDEMFKLGLTKQAGSFILGQCVIPKATEEEKTMRSILLSWVMYNFWLV